MNAIGYIRISTKDQSIYSLPYQEQRIRDYCVRNGLFLKEIYEDNGECSATFDRPDYQALERFIKLHKGEVQYLIILDHDRFSRILVDALRKIEELQKKFGVKVLSVEEPLNLDAADPSVFLQRTFKYAFANHELLNIRRRTARGIRQAMESGRVVNNAPFGYINARDEQDKPILKIDGGKAEIVRKIFEQFVAGVPLSLLRRNAAKMGCKREGHSSLQKMLNNCIYAGLIKLPAYEGKPEKYIKGLHEAIIPESVYWLAHEIINGRPGNKARPKADFPLRGILRCQCGAHMTASYSKGKKKYYMYYQCTVERGKVFRGDLLHEKIEEVLHHLSFSEERVAKIYNFAKEKLSKATSFRALSIKAKEQEFKTEEKMIKDEIEVGTYKVWYAKLNSQKGALETEIVSLKKTDRHVFERLEEAIPVLTNLKHLYIACSLEGQQMLLKKVFEVGFMYDGKVVRTPSLNPALIDNYFSMKEKGLLVVEQPEDFLLKSWSCSA
jgi:site-specific DNA recombinase